MTQTKINWKAVQERLGASQRALDGTLTPDPLRMQEIYRRRAARLASVEIHRKPASGGLSALVFRLGQERYAIEMNELGEVLQFARCVPVPGASRQFLGVINLRGELRAVLDLGYVLAPSNSRGSENGFVLVLRRPEKEIGLKVDHIEDLRQIDPDELTLSILGSFGKGFTSGGLTLLNVDAVLKAAFSKEESRIT